MATFIPILNEEPEAEHILITYSRSKDIPQAEARIETRFSNLQEYIFWYRVFCYVDTWYIKKVCIGIKKSTMSLVGSWFYQIIEEKKKKKICLSSK